MNAIVYTSNSGFTAQYAQMLGEKLDLPVYELSAAQKSIEKGSEILYLGWLFASSVKGYKKAAKQYNIAAVCGVGLCDTGALLDEVRKANALPASLPLFTLQGGMDHAKLRRINKLMIHMLTKGLSGKADRSESEERMLALIQTDGNYVREENLSAVIEWYESGESK